jgi:probable rRNA maturation factor
MTISITARAPSDLPTSEAKLRRRLGKVLAELGLGGRGLSVLFTDDEGMRALNRAFRGKDKPTNVLAFPDTDLARGLEGHLGDVALSVQTLWREAGDAPPDRGRHLYYYLIHAILHLAGHDHELGPEEDEAQRLETERLLELIRSDL